MYLAETQFRDNFPEAAGAAELLEEMQEELAAADKLNLHIINECVNT